ncbi:MAG: phosphoribosylamine--glycine ligase [Actinobacteria bacterium]|nr:phosphoribosylamine--glycine ligase [Actinomycetota bacterium]
MRVLVLGSGGREHALSWRILHSSSCDKVYTMPGNAGTEEIGENIPGNPEKIQDVLEAAKKIRADLVVVGPEAPLVAGIADALRDEGFLVFGPSAQAAMIEGSKAFSKKIMLDNRVPTGKAEIFANFDLAVSYLKTLEPPVVVKADGLCAGKGVVVAKNYEEAESALYAMMVEEKFGSAGKKVLIEEFLEGEEVSFFVITDGKNIVPLTSAQDYKRAYDGDEGPNTGGMGSYSPFPQISKKDEEELIEKIFEPVLNALKRMGLPYIGVLYGGLIKTSENYKVLEFNCRFGDPETQVILPRIEGDFLGLLASAAEGNLNNAPKLSISELRALTVVLASGGYPEKYDVGYEISGIKEAEETGVIVFHAGTKRENGKVLTSGGRVLNITAVEKSFKEAHSKVYNAIKHIRFDKMHFRKDIGERVMRIEG